MGSGRPTIISLYICRTNASEKIMVFLHAKGIYCGPTKSLFRKYIWQTGSDWDEILHEDVGSGSTFPCKLYQPPPNRHKTAFANFLSPKQRIISPCTSRRPISLKLEHKTWTGLVVIFFGTVCEILPIKNHLPVNLSFGFLSTYFRCACSSRCL